MSEKRSVLIAFRVSQEEYDFIKKYAMKVERSVSNLIRRMIKEYLRIRNEEGKL